VKRPPGRHWWKLRDAVFARDGGRCRLCGAVFGVDLPRTEYRCDHVVPLQEGGDNSLGNLRALCRRCHDRVTARHHRRRVGLPPRPDIGADGYPRKEPGLPE
jgi:5-methylcytosine-specific restriction endonuclease McrA